MADSVRLELAGTLTTLLKSGKFSDFTITCGSDTYAVHKAIVCTRSAFFEKAERFNGDSENRNKVDLKDDEPPLIKLLVQYFYEGEYSPKLPDGKRMGESRVVAYTGLRSPSYHYSFPHSCTSHIYCAIQNVCIHHVCGTQCYNHNRCKNFICSTCIPDAYVALPPPQGNAEQLLLHAKMYELADKYDVVGLKELSREKFHRACAKFWDDDKFAAAAHYAFSTTPENDKGLRDIVSNTISQHMSLLNKPAVEALLTEFNGLAVSLLRARGKALGWDKA